MRISTLDGGTVSEHVVEQRPVLDTSACVLVSGSDGSDAIVVARSTSDYEAEVSVLKVADWSEHEIWRGVSRRVGSTVGIAARDRASGFCCAIEGDGVEGWLLMFDPARTDSVRRVPFTGKEGLTGEVMLNIGDIDADGCEDVLVSTFVRSAPFRPGRVELRSGSDMALLGALPAP